MKQIILGMVILSILIIGGVVAEESTDATIASTNESEEQWTMDPNASIALVKVYGADLGMIEDGYGYLLLKWDSEKENFIEVAEDPNGTIDALLTLVETSTSENEAATADRDQLYSAWDDLNASGYQMISSFEANDSVPVLADVTAYQQDSLKLAKAFDTLVSRYIDKNTIDDKLYTLLLYLDLLNGVHAQEGYLLNENPALKDFYDEKMASFDTNAALFESRFPNVSIDDLKEMKQEFDDIIQATSFNTTGTVSDDAFSAQGPILTAIMEAYQQASSI